MDTKKHERVLRHVRHAVSREFEICHERLGRQKPVLPQMSSLEHMFHLVQSVSTVERIGTLQPCLRIWMSIVHDTVALPILTLDSSQDKERVLIMLMLILNASFQNTSSTRMRIDDEDDPAIQQWLATCIRHGIMSEILALVNNRSNVTSIEMSTIVLAWIWKATSNAPLANASLLCPAENPSPSSSSGSEQWKILWTVFRQFEFSSEAQPFRRGRLNTVLLIWLQILKNGIEFATGSMVLQVILHPHYFEPKSNVQTAMPERLAGIHALGRRLVQVLEESCPDDDDPENFQRLSSNRTLVFHFMHVLLLCSSKCPQVAQLCTEHYHAALQRAWNDTHERMQTCPRYRSSNAAFAALMVDFKSSANLRDPVTITTRRSPPAKVMSDEQSFVLNDVASSASDVNALHWISKSAWSRFSNDNTKDTEACPLLDIAQCLDELRKSSE